MFNPSFSHRFKYDGGNDPGLNGVDLTRRCIILLGGSFDPVHIGHVELGKYFCKLFKTNELRLIPAGNPWQKPLLKATPEQRIDMLRLAFEPLDLSVTGFANTN